MKTIKRIDIPCGQTYLFELADGNLLESGDVFMSREAAYGERPYRFADFDAPSDLNKRVMTVCTMAGCPVGCRFCASSRTFRRKLSAEEIVGQVDAMLRDGLPLGRHTDPNQAAEFRVLYTRMGEPMLNAAAVLDSVKTLINRYPHVIIGMSTSGFKKGLDLFLDNPAVLPHLDMQFSLHSTNDEERKWLFDANIGASMLSIPQIAQYVNRWYAHTSKKISLNVILFDNFTYDFTSLLQYFDSEKIWLRLSPWNVVEKSLSYGFDGLLKTDDVLQKAPISSRRLEQILESAQRSGIAYSYAPAIDEEIKHQVACGQAMEAFRSEQTMASTPAREAPLRFAARAPQLAADSVRLATPSSI